MGALEFFCLKAVLIECALEFVHHGRPPVFRVLEENSQRGDFVGVGLHKFLESLKIIFGVVELAVAFEFLRRDGVFVLNGGEERSLSAQVFEQEFLKIGVAEQRHCVRKFLLQLLRQFLRKPAHVALWNPSLEKRACLRAHVLVNSQEALCQDTHVVIAVHVLPDVLTDFADC